MRSTHLQLEPLFPSARIGQLLRKMILTFFIAFEIEFTKLSWMRERESESDRDRGRKKGRSIDRQTGRQTEATRRKQTKRSVCPPARYLRLRCIQGRSPHSRTFARVARLVPGQCQVSRHGTAHNSNLFSAISYGVWGGRSGGGFQRGKRWPAGAARVCWVAYAYSRILAVTLFLGGLSIRLLVCVYFALFCGMLVSNGDLWSLLLSFTREKNVVFGYPWEDIWFYYWYVTLVFILRLHRK